MTPYEIGIMLHIYTRAGPFSDSGIPSDAPIFSSTLDALSGAGLIEGSTTTDHGFSATSRGRAYVEFLMQMPLPEQEWVLPEQRIEP